MLTMIVRSMHAPQRILARCYVSRTSEAIYSTRRFSDDNNNTKVPERATEWRKSRLDQLEHKFTNGDPSKFIQSDTELQPEWKSMESRVTNRRTLTKEETGGKTGRSNIRQTEEDVWLQSGLYHANDNETNDKTKET